MNVEFDNVVPVFELERILDFGDTDLELYEPRIQAIAWCPVEPLLAVATVWNVTIWDATTGTVVRNLHWGNGEHLLLAWSPDGELLACGASCPAYRFSIWVWSSAAGEIVQQFVGPSYDPMTGRVATAKDLAWAGDGDTLVAGYAESTWLWDVGDWDLRHKLKASWPGHLLAARPGSPEIAVGHEGRIFIVDCRDSSIVLRLAGSHERLGCLAWSPDGRAIVAGVEGGVQVWSSATGSAIASLETDARKITAVSMSLRSEILAARGDDERLRMWSTGTWAPLGHLAAKTWRSGRTLDFHPTEPLLAAIDGERVSVWRFDPARRPDPNRSRRGAVALLPAGTPTKRKQPKLGLWDDIVWGGEPTLARGIGIVLDELGLGDEESLERALAQTSQDHSTSYLYSDLWKGFEPARHPLGEQLLAALAETAERLHSTYKKSGLRQFIWSDGASIDEEHLRQALFLARTTTILTPHRFEQSRDVFVTEDGHETRHESWSFSHDFIRDLLRHRRALDSGSVILLPESAIQKHEGNLLVARGDWISKGTCGIDHSATRRLRLDQPEDARNIPQIRLPWIDGVTVDDVLNIREDEWHLLQDFQRSYGKALEEYLSSASNPDFERVSQEIANDLVQPAIDKIDRRYQRIVGLHAKLAATGAAVSMIPLASAIVTASSVATALAAGPGLGALAGLVTTFGANLATKSYRLGELAEEEYYVLWKLGHKRRK